jgi:hypothetical protein
MTPLANANLTTLFQHVQLTASTYLTPYIDFSTFFNSGDQVGRADSLQTSLLECSKVYTQHLETLMDLAKAERRFKHSIEVVSGQVCTFFVEVLEKTLVGIDQGKIVRFNEFSKLARFLTT